MSKFITIRTFTYPHEAYVLKGLLESEGITCFVMDEQTIQANPFYSNAIGGVKLQVPEDQYEEALKIINDAGPDDEPGPIKEQEKTHDDPALIRCPACGSAEVSNPILSRSAFAFGILLLGFPFLFWSREYHCFGCGTDFKIK